jgi:oligo-alginate lyase
MAVCYETRGVSIMRIATATLLVTMFLPAQAQNLLKASSTLYPADIAARVRANVAGDPWAAGVRDGVVEAAAYWRHMSDDELWKLMFGPTIERSWMVWSNGYSPVTGEPVPMYNWKPDAQNRPWKLQDPTSGEWFPKNDFKAFYDSGLDERGIFDAARADRTLLFNTDHPDPNDPLHTFGVDDGTGYVNDNGERWRFIGTYLIYGQWKQLIVGGIRVLSSAYMLTADPVYARKAGILLDRVADLYPEFDFGAQAILYEGPGARGYVSTWHDACEETREMVMAYDMIFEALRDDAALVAFLSKKAAETGFENPKASFADIQRNIEGRILRDTLANPHKVESNYPRTEVMKAVITAVLAEPQDAFWAIVDPMIARATAVDGVTGEKGLAGYSSFTISGMASFLSEFSKADPDFLPAILARHPRLRETYRFFIDTLCLQKYYPLIGDTGHYAAAMDRYIGIDFLIPGDNLKGWSNWTLLAPSNYRFLWSLYEITGDEAYVQVLYWANGYKTEGLPYDIYGGNSQEFRTAVADVIERDGRLIDLGSVNKQQWHLAILRSGRAGNARALWLDYDAGGGHGHQDGLNLGLFAHGLDFMPEMGYPPVQFGGWGSPRARWYTMTAAHNTVVIDGKNQLNGAGETTLLFDGAKVRAVRATGTAMAQADRYERTAVLVDIDEERFYVLDVFRVRGGADHTKFQQGHYGTLATTGLTLAPADDYGFDTQTRNFHMDPAAQPGWHAEWSIEDKQKLLSQPATLGMRYWDLTTGAAAGTSEAWIVVGMFAETAEMWIPRVTVRRTGEDPLESTFIAVIDPWKDTPTVQGVQRLRLHAEDADTEVALELRLPNGLRDILILRDPERMAMLPEASAGDPALTTDAELTLLRIDASGNVHHAALVLGTTCTAGPFELHTTGTSTSVESY